MNVAENYYPKPTCMECGEECNTTEEVDVGGQVDDIDAEKYSHIELWCYCRQCDIETFHPIPKICGKEYE